MIILAIALGGAAGALLRYWLSAWVTTTLGIAFPYGTLAVNVVGSLLAGTIYVVLAERALLDTALRALLLVGLFGSFTTFSAFSLETVYLLKDGQLVKVALNVLGSVLLAVGAAWVGVTAARSYFAV